MKIYNTLTAKKEEFKPRESGKVSIYICGPTVYNYIHIGNARAYVSFDAIIRYLKYKGYKVKYVRNLTDVDDKIIKRASEENTTTKEITAKYTKVFHKDMNALGVQPPTIEPKATETIGEMIETITQLISKGLAYEIDGDVYFAVENFTDYGKLSKRSLDEMLAGARIEVDSRKKNPADFALWKKAKEHEPSWPSPWGDGRPGWHIECSTMSIKYLGMGFDIHGGGQDLIFPHHENEIAQAEGATGKKPFTRYWMHNGFLNVEAEKMAKSVGNVILIKDLENQYSGRLDDLRNHLRMLFLSTHYRSPLNFTDETLEKAKAATNRIQIVLDKLQEFDTDQIDVKNYNDSSIKQMTNDFESAMDDDFNTPNALAHIFSFIKKINTLLDKPESDSETKKLFKASYIAINNLLTQVFGFSFPSRTSKEIIAKYSKMIVVREEARKAGDFDKADQIRDEIEKAGFTIEDTPKGPKIKKK